MKITKVKISPTYSCDNCQSFFKVEKDIPEKHKFCSTACFEKYISNMLQEYDWDTLIFFIKCYGKEIICSALAPYFANGILRAKDKGGNFIQDETKNK